MNKSSHAYIIKLRISLISQEELIWGKPIKDLVFKDNFMFAAVMMDEDIAKGVPERTLGIEISRVEVSYEKSIVYNPEYKGVRLDAYVKDQQGTHFDVEMQVANEEIKKRARYYHSQIDMELLLAGTDYVNLPNTYVIFICDFDPLGLGKYKYTMKQIVAEDLSYRNLLRKSETVEKWVQAI